MAAPVMAGMPALRLPEGAAPGRRVVGSGGSATVYRVAAPGGACAVKVLHGRLASSSWHAQRFLEEAALLARFRGDGVPEFVATATWDGRPALLYRYVPGLPLHRFAAAGGGRLAPLTAIEIGVALLNVLCRLHQHPQAVVHGDLTAENLILDRGHRVWVVDFGSARSVDDAAPPGPPAVKPRWLSPEQARGEPWAPASDLYQAGLVLYRLLAGRHANPGQTPAQARVMAANPPALDLRGIHPALRAFLARTLDPRPERRWSSARACRDALQWLHAELHERLPRGGGRPPVAVAGAKTPLPAVPTSAPRQSPPGPPGDPHRHQGESETCIPETPPS